MQELANEMADIIEDLGPKWKEYYVDGMSKKSTPLRCYCTKTSIVTNLKFRKQKLAPKLSTTIPIDESQATGSDALVPTVNTADVPLVL